MPRARKGKELSVRLGNNIGTGAGLFSKLKEGGVNVIASCCYLIGQEARFTIVADDSDAAARILGENGLETSAQEVLLVELPNSAGAFAQVLQEISKLGVDVSSAYITAMARIALGVLKTGDDDRVLEALNQQDPEPVLPSGQAPCS
jgi:hypothetical protein